MRVLRRPRVRGPRASGQFPSIIASYNLLYLQLCFQFIELLLVAISKISNIYVAKMIVYCGIGQVQFTQAAQSPIIIYNKSVFI
jgi:hypothetical protein